MKNQILENIIIFTQSSIKITSGKNNIYFDPFQLDIASHDADYIFLTHDHLDHFSPDDIQKVVKDTTIFVAPEKMAEKVKVYVPTFGQLIRVLPGVVKEVKGQTFETVPAYNNLKPFHPKKCGWVGYILQIEGKRVYVAGDTDMTKENQKVKCDVAMVPIGGTFTMDAKKAAELINLIRPEIAIPTHYGSLVGKREDAETFREKVKAPIHVEVIPMEVKCTR